MSNFNYSWYRSRLKIREVKRIPHKGRWVTVSAAAKILNVSDQTIRIRYLRNKMPVIKKQDRIYVNISDQNQNI